jgi:hypothetical protein
MLASRAVEVWLPALLDWQEKAIAGAARFNVAAVGRRAGKTVLGEDLAADSALDGQPVGWWSPTYREMIEVWQQIRDTLQPVTSRISASEKRLELLTGGVIEFWSADNEDAGRGRKYARAIVDEAAMIPRLGRMWAAVIRPTLIDLKGDAWFLSTPRGLNDFWHLYRAADSDPEWRSYTAPSSVNPMLPAGEIDAARRTMTDSLFRQEILAEFLDLTGSVFRFVRECATAKREGRQEGHRYAVGVDLAITTDFTVIVVLDVTGDVPKMVHMDRFTGIPWRQQLDRIAAIAQEYQPDVVAIDQTGLGDMPVTELAHGLPGVNVWGIRFNSGNKQDMVQELALGFERQAIAILDESLVTGELMAYEAKRTATGLWTYNAPAGGHDDIVAALMLAYHASSHGVLSIGSMWS